MATAIDQDGNYEEPLYGRISFTHLLSTKTFAGQKVSVKISRDGEEQNLRDDAGHKPPADYVSEPYVVDRAPRYCVVDGLIFEELSRQYLKEWGGDWQKQAPQRLVYLDRYQGAMIPQGRQSDRDPQPGTAVGEQHRVRGFEVSRGHERSTAWPSTVSTTCPQRWPSRWTASTSSNSKSRRGVVPRCRHAGRRQPQRAGELQSAVAPAAELTPARGEQPPMLWRP